MPVNNTINLESINYLAETLDNRFPTETITIDAVSYSVYTYDDDDADDNDNDMSLSIEFKRQVKNPLIYSIKYEKFFDQVNKDGYMNWLTYHTINDTPKIPCYVEFEGDQVSKTFKLTWYFSVKTNFRSHAIVDEISRVFK